ncbi:hypothetical protein ACCO45_009333 [Purpureocillium lilacinum]|uniref:Uncharacterized protein n=1 Tax=Purpureocillium lilacinum TaxID=33203 RepID=A0ACC4DK54_PURLI
MPRPAFSAVEQKRVTTKDPPPMLVVASYAAGGRKAQRGESGESGDAHTPSFFGFVAQDEDPGLPSARGEEEEEEDMRLTLSPGHISRMPESAAPIVHHFRVRSSPPRIQTLSEHATPSPPRDSASRAAPISRSRPSPGDTQHRTIIIVIIIVSLEKLIGSSSHPHDSSSGVAEAAIACPPAGRQTSPSPRLTYLHALRIHTSPLHASPGTSLCANYRPPPQKVRAKHSTLYEYNRPSTHRIASHLSRFASSSRMIPTHT